MFMKSIIFSIGNAKDDTTKAMNHVQSQKYKGLIDILSKNKIAINASFYNQKRKIE